MAVLKRLLISTAAFCLTAGFVAHGVPALTPCREAVRDCLWLEAESFSEHGGWMLDTQFVHKMGSACLIAKGVLKPLPPARTSIDIPTTGTWRVWARTRDWLPEHSPGRFTVEIAGLRGNDLGVSKRLGWGWDEVGEFTLVAGRTEIALVDLSGGFARCDAIFFAYGGKTPPPDGGEALADARRRYSGMDGAIADGGEYDVVVAGAGPGGLGASLAAARLGMRVMLVHDRPVLGGNSSIEHHVTIGGSGYNYLDGVVDSREGGILEEARLVRRHLSGKERAAMGDAYRFMVDGERNIAERPNERVVSAEKEGRRIIAVTSMDVMTGARRRYRGKVFIDGTGDGWLGRFAGVALMHGREGRAEYGEKAAPEQSDDITMSGSLDDYIYRETASETAYETPAWAKVLPEGFNRPDVRGVNARWWLEHAGTFDELEDPERARDELIRISLDYWGWIRRHPRFGALARRCVLEEIRLVNGRREGWRILGDYVLTAQDCIEGRVFPDAITVGGWLLDVHDPLGVMNPKGNGKWCADQTRLYTIPYRCIYSRDLDNLLMAGRNISVTHVALGSTRIMGTIFTLGQAAGTSAAIMVRDGLSARAVGEQKIEDLRQQLLKDDQYIRGAVGNDPLDLARGSRISASSTVGEIRLTRDDPDFMGVDKGNWAWRQEIFRDVAVCFPRGRLDRMEKVSCLLRESRKTDRAVTLDVYESDDIVADDASRSLLGTATARVRKGGTQFAEFTFDHPLALSRKWIWLKIRKAEGLYWLRRKHVFAEGGTVGYGKKPGRLELQPGYQLAFVTIPAATTTIDACPEYVVDGHGRPDTLPMEGTSTHAWRSDPACALPQWIRLDFDAPVLAREIYLVFDSGLCTGEPQWPYPPELARNYEILGLADGKWTTLATAKDNYLRLRTHRFPPVALSAVKVRVDATWGVREARIQEIRVYGPQTALAPARLDKIKTGKDNML